MTPETLIGGTGQLLSLPEVCLRVNAMLDDPHSSAEDIAEVLAQDAALTAHLLRIVNSAFYGMPGKIETISRAITIIGTKDLRDLAVMAITCELFVGIPPDLVNMETFWQGAITSGVIARALARKCHVLHPERLFVMGVLHDIGRLVIYQQLPQQARDILLISKGREDLVIQSEVEVLGFTHPQVGYELARHWQLPDTIANTIRWHHSPEQAEEGRLEVALIHIATVISDLMIWNDATVSLDACISSQVWQITGLDGPVCTAAVADVGGEVRELYGILMENAQRVKED